MRRIRPLLLMAALASLPAGAAPGRDPAPAAAPPKVELPPGVPTTEETVFLPTVNEVKLGLEVAAEVEKEYVVIADGPAAERLARVASAVLAAALTDPELPARYRRTYRLPRRNDRSLRIPFRFSFKVVRPRSGIPEVNAFALPGGPIYVTADMLKETTSDHELAAVLAHEIVHVLFHHSAHQARRQSRELQSALWAALAAALVGAVAGSDAGSGMNAGFNTLWVGYLLSLSKLHRYSREMEREADLIGIAILARTPYSPVGMLTLMKKTANEELRRGFQYYSQLATHPTARERVREIERELARRGIPFDPGIERQVSQTFRVEAAPARWQGRNVGEVYLNGELFFRAVVGEGARTPLERAQQICAALTAALQANVTLRQTRLTDDGVSVCAGPYTLLTVLPGDAEAERTTRRALAEQALKVLQTALWREKLNGIY